MDAIQDDDDDPDDPEFGLQEDKNQQMRMDKKYEEENAIYLEQVDDQHQILDGDEPMDMDQSNSQKRLMKVAMQKRTPSNLTNDVLLRQRRAATASPVESGDDNLTPRQKENAGQVVPQTVPNKREDDVEGDHASLVAARYQSRSTAR